jgi:lipoate-protein ligase A
MQIVHEPEAGAVRNMALDEAMLEASILKRYFEPLLRIYAWSRPSVSFGSNQKISTQLVDRVREFGFDVVRRPSGGGAVVHQGDVTYSFVAPDPGGATLDVYRWAARGILEGLRALGLAGEVIAHSAPANAVACFSRSTGADIEVGGRKICGSAQVRRRGWILQHGSIPLTDHRHTAALLFGQPEQDCSTCLEELAPGIDWKTAAEAFEIGFKSIDPRQLATERKVSDVEELLARAIEAGHALLDGSFETKTHLARLKVNSSVAEPSTFALESG